SIRHRASCEAGRPGFVPSRFAGGGGQDSHAQQHRRNAHYILRDAFQFAFRSRKCDAEPFLFAAALPECDVELPGMELHGKKLAVGWFQYGGKLRKCGGEFPTDGGELETVEGRLRRRWSKRKIVLGVLQIGGSRLQAAGRASGGGGSWL